MSTTEDVRAQIAKNREDNTEAARDAMRVLAKAGVSKSRAVKLVRSLQGNGWTRVTAKEAGELFDDAWSAT